LSLNKKRVFQKRSDFYPVIGLREYHPKIPAMFLDKSRVVQLQYLRGFLEVIRKTWQQL